MSKVKLSGLINNISTNPFQTFSHKRKENSSFLSFDISFDICDQDGKLTHVWFNRSLRLPPPLNDGDYIEITGRYGHVFGLFGRKNFYAAKIMDKKRMKEYTSWRNLDLRADNVQNESAGRPFDLKSQ